MSFAKSKIFRSGDYYIWLSGAAIALSLVLVGGLFLLILINGLSGFWPKDLVQFTLPDGRKILGAVLAREPVPNETALPGQIEQYRIQLKQGNRDLYGQDFIWADESQLSQPNRPVDALVVERREWGQFFGFFKELRSNDQSVRGDSGALWIRLQDELRKSAAIRDEAQALLKNDIGALSYQQEKLRLKERALEQSGDGKTAALAEIQLQLQELSQQNQQLEQQLAELRARDTAALVVTSVDGQEKAIPLAEIIGVFRPNSMTLLEKLSMYLHQLFLFVWEDPRESNTEGGVFPAIFGTVMLVLTMSVCVTPFGVLAAVYLREYARQGKFVSAVRIAVNNLAGVPSIVFGVFGVGFFVYAVGGTIDQLFYADTLPTPTYGTGGILWASLTLALLTVPTVIVATEEGLAALPKHLREASYALGATKFETLWRVIIPALTPAILTGAILAVARAAGEVAPLMITGVVKLAPSLPIDSHWPFLHLDRKFMHLGFHIYDVGFQSPNIEAARPMVYSSTLLLLLVVVLLNLTALIMRNQLRKRYRTSAV